MIVITQGFWDNLFLLALIVLGFIAAKLIEEHYYED